MPGGETSDWDRYASEQYEILLAEEAYEEENEYVQTLPPYLCHIPQIALQGSEPIQFGRNLTLLNLCRVLKQRGPKIKPFFKRASPVY